MGWIEGRPSPRKVPVSALDPVRHLLGKRPDSEIGLMLKPPVTKMVVNRIRNELGIGPYRPRGTFDQGRFIACVFFGMTGPQIEMAMKCHASTVSKYGKLNGIKPRPSGWHEGRAKPGEGKSPEKTREMEITRPITNLIRGWKHSQELKEWHRQQRQLT